MRAAEHGWITVVFRVLAALGLVYCILPVALMFPLSIESGHILQFPPQSLSLHWYREFFASESWLDSMVLSFKVAAGATLIATVAGTLAAIGLARTSSRIRDTAWLILMSPLFLPAIVIATAIYAIYASLRIVGTPMGLVAAHSVLALPFVLVNVSAAMASVPRALEESAMSLGAPPAATFFHITVPLIARGIGAGAIFAFLISFDEVVIAMFLSGSTAVTLPKRMLDGIFFEMTPMLAAVSVLLVMGNLMLAGAGLALARSRNRLAS